MACTQSKQQQSHNYGYGRYFSGRQICVSIVKRNRQYNSKEPLWISRLKSMAVLQPYNAASWIPPIMHNTAVPGSMFSMYIVLG